MGFRGKVMVGLVVLLLPVVGNGLWSLLNGQKANQRVNYLEKRVYPALALSHLISLKTGLLKEKFSMASLDTNPERIEDIRQLVAELDQHYRDLSELTKDLETERLSRLHTEYANQGILLLETLLNPEEEIIFLDSGSDLAQAALNLAVQIDHFREKQNEDFKSYLQEARLTSQRNFVINSVSLILALLVTFLLGRALFVWISVHQGQLQQSLQYEEALSKISQLFTSQFDPDLHRVVHILGEVVHSDHAFLGLFKSKTQTWERTLFWSKETTYEGLSFLDLSTFKKPLLDGKTIQIEDESLAPFPNLLAVPIQSRDGLVQGTIGFSRGNREKNWGKEDHRILKVASEMLANFIARMQAEEELVYDALHDSLTGLPNRALLMDRLKHAMEKSKRSESYLAVMFLDLDRFKNINDTLGHPAGDALLKEIAFRLTTCVRGHDTVARLAGDEFVILLEDLLDSNEALNIGERILQQMQDPATIEGQDWFPGISIGLVCFEMGEYNNPHDVIRDADIAMYAAKSAGKGCLKRFDKEMHAHSLAYRELEQKLRKALEASAFKMVYQPVYDIESRTICGLEALIRWPQPDGGMIPPDQFIPVAEETGLILDLGNWIIEHVFQQILHWKNAGKRVVPVNINVSAIQLNQPDFLIKFESMIKSSGIDPSWIKLEITESVIMDHVESKMSMLRELNKLGVHTLIDDFGTGYSSLVYLKKFQLHTLKIDRAFVNDVPHQPDGCAIAAAIIGLALNLNLKVVAEGVENEDQITFLKKHGCHMAQGYLLSRPLPPETIEDALETNL